MASKQPLALRKVTASSQQTRRQWARKQAGFRGRIVRKDSSGLCVSTALLLCKDCWWGRREQGWCVLKQVRGWSVVAVQV